MVSGGERTIVERFMREAKAACKICNDASRTFTTSARTMAHRFWSWDTVLAKISPRFWHSKGPAPSVGNAVATTAPSNAPSSDRPRVELGYRGEA
jgi:hypothetical protein